MTRPSELPLHYKVAMVAAFVITMGVVWLIAHQLFHNWLPVELVRYIAVAMIALAAGVVAGYRLSIRPYRNFQR